MVEIWGSIVIATVNCAAFDLRSYQQLHGFRHSTEEVLVVPGFFVTSTNSVIVTNNKAQQFESEQKKENDSKRMQAVNYTRLLTDGIPTYVTVC